MKKMVCIVLTLCMVMLALPALADTAAGAETPAEETTNLDSLMGLFSGMGSEGNGTAKEGETAETSEFDLGALLGLMGITAATEDTYVPVENAEQFHGTWELSRVKAAGYEIPMDMLDKLGLDEDIVFAMTVSADSIKMKVSDTETKDIPLTDCKIVDGGLNMKMDGDSARMRMTESGELCLLIGENEAEGFELLFTAAK